MAQTHARAWWADVEHLREDIEQRKVDRAQADRDDLAARRTARARRREELDAARETARLAVGDDRTAIDTVPRGRFVRAEHSVARTSDTSESPVLDFSDLLDEPAAAPARRTIEIKGRTVPAPAMPTDREAAAAHPGAVERRRPPRRAVERVGSRPDRVALWALMMGIMLILVAIGTN